MENSQVKGLIDIIELARLAGNLQRLDISPVINVLPQRSFAQGGYTTPKATTIPPFSDALPTGSIDSTNKLVADAVTELKNEIKHFQKWRFLVAIELIKKRSAAI